MIKWNKVNNKNKQFNICTKKIKKIIKMNAEISVKAMV